MDWNIADQHFPGAIQIVKCTAAVSKNLGTLRRGAANSGAVIHTAFNHEFLYVANCESDRQVIVALVDAVAGSGKLLILTSGTGMDKPVFSERI